MEFGKKMTTPPEDEPKADWDPDEVLTRAQQMMMYDSSFNGRLSCELQVQIASIYRLAIKDKKIMVTVLPVQQQTAGTLTCGVFAIAFAYHFCRGDSIEKLSFSEGEMGEHLVQCLNEQKFGPFPYTTSKVQRCRRKHIFVHLYCTCLQPEWIDTKIIQCDLCQEWFHFKYVGICIAPDSWLCVQCK